MKMRHTHYRGTRDQSPYLHRWRSASRSCTLSAWTRPLHRPVKITSAGSLWKRSVAGDRTIVDLGTRFKVDLAEDTLRVALYEGSVGGSRP